MTKWIVYAFIGLSGIVSANITDVITFGNTESEQQHQLDAGRSEIITGGLGQSARRLLAPQTKDWQGGQIAFVLKVNPQKQNYITLRLWGSDVTENRLMLYCRGKQIGYRHLGDIDILDYGSQEPAYPGRFYYTTTPLPEALTQGKTELDFQIRSTGRIWGYGRDFEQYQKSMTEPSRGMYAVYTHTDGYFCPPESEKQGNAPAEPAVHAEPGMEVLTGVKERVNREVESLLRSQAPVSQMQMLLLARAYDIDWTVAYKKQHTIEQILTALDTLFAAYCKNPKLAQEEPSTWNPDWFGLGVCGQVIVLRQQELKPFIDADIPGYEGRMVTRRRAYTEMLAATRDWHRLTRRLYTNQSMINDVYGIYRANRGIAVLEPDKALPEPQALRYLYESVGLEPWRDSDPGGRQWNVGANYMQLTAKGLTKELGYVGSYGEVVDWVADIYDATRPAPDQPGDERIKAQLVKIAKARAAFRHPALDAGGNRTMRLEQIVGWRDSRYPGYMVYGQRATRDASALQAAALTLDPYLVGYAQQMIADNQFFASEVEAMNDRAQPLRTTIGRLETPRYYELIKAQPSGPYRLPMTPGQPDFVFSDEQDGVVAIKNADEILYVSLYWRAYHAVNFLARVHYITPNYDRIAVVKVDTEFENSGMVYKRPDWTNFGFGNGGPRYPIELHSAHAGEVLPIARIPEGIQFRPGQESVYAGKGSFYTLRYGNYLIATNCTESKTHELKIPDDFMQASELVSGKKIQFDKMPVSPLSTVVLYKGKSRVPAAAKYDFSALSDRIQNWVDKGYYPGASCLIAKDNKVVYEKYFGSYNPDTVVFIASAGKWLAAATIAAIVDEGKLSWDDPASKWIPELNDNKGKATLRQLMSHTAGYPDYQPSNRRRDDYQTLIESVRQIVPLEPNDIPGAKFQYGGLAMQVAGRMAELATGKDWETLFQEKIAKPLVMKNTHFIPVDPGGGHSPMLGGGARSTLRDYANFLSMIHNNGIFDGKRILSEKAIAQMQADQIRGAKLTKPEFVETVRGNTHNGVYGIGQWREVLDDKGNAMLISSPSWAGTYPWIDKACNVYGIFLTHVDTKIANPAGFSAFYSSPVLPMMVREAVEVISSGSMK